MKNKLRLASAFIISFALFCSSLVAFGNPPPITARQALDIAEKNLAERGLDKKLYVVGVTLERTSMFSEKAYWLVKWSEPIPASNPSNREVGIKVNMDGSAVRLVKEPGAR